MISITHRNQLPDLMRHLKLPMIAVEVGTAEFNFSSDLLNAGVETLYSVDNWENIPGQKGDGGHNSNWHSKNFEKAVERSTAFGERSIILKGRSVEMAQKIPDNTIGLAYIDCDHSLSGVLNDIAAYWPKLVSGGLMGFHDFEAVHYGVKEAVTQFAKENNLEVYLLPENKKEDAGAYIIKP